MAERQGTFKDKDGDRWYRDPANSQREWAGVTSILSIRRVAMLEQAKVNGTAMYAAHNRHDLAGMTKAGTYSLLRDSAFTLPDWDVGRNFGTAVHQVLENVIKGVPLDTDLQEVEGTLTYPVANNFTEWVPKWWDQFCRAHDVRVVEIEETVVSPLGYGGSFDILAMVDGVLTFVDAKSNKGGPRPSVALQNAAYAECPEIIDMVTGARRELPRAERSAVLWLRPEGWNLYPLRFGPDVFRDFFAHLVLFQYAKEREYLMIGEGLDSDGPDAIQFRRWNT